MQTQPELPVISKRYCLLDLIGQGGMGRVYRTLDRFTGKIIALKSVTAALRQGSDLSRRLALAREFKILASLRHPNIISVLDYGFDTQQQPFFTMDLLDNAVHLSE